MYTACRSIALTIAELVEGESTMAEVTRSLGPPSALSRTPAGAVFLYERLNITEYQFGPSLFSFINIRELKLFKIVYGEADLERQIAAFIFDGNGVLTAQHSIGLEQDLGSGGGIQFFVEIDELVEVDYLIKEPNALHWGDQMLRPLPETLNAGSDITSGEHGLELTGTPSSVGQRTLEMQ